MGIVIRIRHKQSGDAPDRLIQKLADISEYGQRMAQSLVCIVFVGIYADSQGISLLKFLHAILQQRLNFTVSSVIRRNHRSGVLLPVSARSLRKLLGCAGRCMLIENFPFLICQLAGIDPIHVPFDCHLLGPAQIIEAGREIREGFILAFVNIPSRKFNHIRRRRSPAEIGIRSGIGVLLFRVYQLYFQSISVGHSLSREGQGLPAQKADRYIIGQPVVSFRRISLRHFQSGHQAAIALVCIFISKSKYKPAVFRICRDR